MGKWLAMLDEEIGFHEKEMEIEKPNANETENPRPLTKAEEDLIIKWLAFIGETDVEMINDCLVRSERMPDVRKYFIGRAANELSGNCKNDLISQINFYGE